MRRLDMKYLGTVRLTTPRLILRRFGEEDAEAMYQNWASHDIVTKYLTWPTHESIEVTRSVLKHWEEQYKDNQFYQWCIELKSLKEPIGSISVVSQDAQTKCAEIGYCIGEQYWNKGITSEALRAVMDFLWNHEAFQRIEAKHDLSNPASGRVMQKCGLRYEGTKIAAGFNNTGVCDLVLYGAVKC